MGARAPPPALACGHGASSAPGGAVPSPGESRRGGASSGACLATVAEKASGDTWPCSPAGQHVAELVGAV
jgi:hypothetical protein